MKVSSQNSLVCPYCNTQLLPWIVDGKQRESIADDILLYGWKCLQGHRVLLPNKAGLDSEKNKKIA